MTGWVGDHTNDRVLRDYERLVAMDHSPLMDSTIRNHCESLRPECSLPRASSDNSGIFCLAVLEKAALLATGRVTAEVDRTRFSGHSVKLPD